MALALVITSHINIHCFESGTLKSHKEELETIEQLELMHASEPVGLGYTGNSKID